MTHPIVIRRWGSDVPGREEPVPVSTVATMLAALGVSKATAEREWRAILDHKWYLSERVGRDVGLRTAVVDYFENVRPQTTPARSRSEDRIARMATGPVFALERALTDFVDAVGGAQSRLH